MTDPAAAGEPSAPAVAVYSGLGFAHADADTHVQYRRRVT